MNTNGLLLILRKIRLREAFAILLCLGFGIWLLSAQTSAPPFTAPVTPVSHAEPGNPPLKPQAIEALRVGQRVWGENPNREEVDTSLPEPDQATWRSLALQMVKPDGEVLDIVLLRPLDWVEATQATPEATIELDLPELGAAGPARVLAIDPSPPIQFGPGHVITGTFAHRSSNQLLNITVEGQAKPIGVTDNHPIWSEDRQEFVEAGQLEVGESLLTLAGPAPITSITPRGPPEPVYNLEIHGEHVYCVTTAGVLVHNTYVDPKSRYLYREPILERSKVDRYKPFNQKLSDASEPITIVEDKFGNRHIVQGNHRMAAAAEQGLDKVGVNLLSQAEYEKLTGLRFNPARGSVKPIIE